MSERDFDTLPEWLQQAWSLSPEIARKAESELCALRQRVEELERERDAARSGHDYAVAEQAKSTAYITELLQERWQSAFDMQTALLDIKRMADHNTKQATRIAELEASSSELMAQLDAFGNADAPNGEAIVTPNNCRHCNRSAEKMREAASVVALSIPLQFYDTRTQREIAKAINALPLPACDGCNPLKPE